MEKNYLEKQTLENLLELYDYCRKEDELAISNEIFNRTGILPYVEEKDPFLDESFKIGFVAGCLVLIILKVVVGLFS